MKLIKSVFAVFTVCALLALPAQAHFLEIVGTPPAAEKGKPYALTLAFGHPNKGTLLKMDAPTKVEVITPSGTQDLTKEVAKGKEDNTMNVSFTPDADGDYVIVVEGAPYYEKDENQFIAQTAKMIAHVGAEEGDWNKPVGLPVEIVPLSRPYALLEGSSFTGQVLVDGKPAPNTKVEVTLAKCCDPIVLPSTLHDTQTIFTDANGVFTVAMLLSGWWGFAAITEPGKTMKSPDGKDVPVETDGVLWVYTDLMKMK
ncbi:MAG: DUF4198 domain-containing protein [Verrucomicrobiota bacterium]